MSPLPPSPPSSSPPPPPFLLLLASKHAFVTSSLAAGKVPSAPQLASFLQGLVNELLPHVRAAPSFVGDILKSELANLGWAVATNAPAPGSSPPTPEVVLAFLDGMLAELLPNVATARAAAAQASKALAAEEHELSLMEEEALDGSLSGKQQKALVACQQRIPALRAAVHEATRLVEVVEARLTPSELAAFDEAAAAQRGVDALRIAQMTREAAEASAGGGAKGGGGKGGGSKGGRGGGGGSRAGGGSSDDPHGREARAADAAARAGAKASAAAKAAEEAIAALRASDITLVEASELRKGGHVLLPSGGAGREEPCRIAEITTSKTGKHGHAKLSITATDVASGRKVERNLRADEKVTVPGKRWLLAIAAPAGS